MQDGAMTILVTVKYVLLLKNQLLLPDLNIRLITEPDLGIHETNYQRP